MAGSINTQSVRECFSFGVLSSLEGEGIDERDSDRILAQDKIFGHSSLGYGNVDDFEAFIISGDSRESATSHGLGG